MACPKVTKLREWLDEARKEKKKWSVVSPPAYAAEEYRTNAVVAEMDKNRAWDAYHAFDFKDCRDCEVK